MSATRDAARAHRRWPLRRRLVALMLAVVAVILVATALGFMFLVFDALHADVNDRLRDAAQTARARYPDATPTSAPIMTDVTVAVVDADGELDRILQPHTRGGPTMPAPADAARAVAEPDTPISAGAPNGRWRLLATALPDDRWLLAAQPVTDLQAHHNHLVQVWLTAVLGTLLVTLFLTTHLVAYGLRPLTAVAAEAGRIEAGDLSRRLPATTRDEISQLAAALNRMLDRVQASLAEQQAVEDRLRRFVNDAGHELRTPVTAIRGWTDLYGRGGIPDGDLPTAMRRVGDEAHRIGALVDQLLLLARLDGHAAIAGTGTRRVVDLAEIVRDAVLDARAVEPDRPVVCELPTDGTARVVGDPMALHQIPANLLANIRAHTPPGTPARIHLHRVPAAGGDRVVLRVTDDGPGLPADQRDKVFERFYRADPGRPHRDGGGAGLGLSIVAAIVASHDGQVRTEPVTRGFGIRVSLPAAPTG